jgi:hypothetical protein
MNTGLALHRHWRQAAGAVALAVAVAAVTACGSHPGAGLTRAQYPACQQQGQAIAGYLTTGQPTSDDPAYGTWRQQILALAGQSQQLAVRQYADIIIEACDQQTTAAEETAAATAAQNATGEAQTTAAAAQQAVWQHDVSAYLTPGCAEAGGQLSVSGLTAACDGVPYYGTDGQTYRDNLSTSSTELLADTSDGGGTSATPAECASGTYPDGAAGPVQGHAGHYAYGLCLSSWSPS